MKKRVLILVVVAALLLIVFLRELGIINLNFYQSEVATDRVATAALTMPRGDDAPVSYDLDITYDGESISSIGSHIVGRPALDIRADLVHSVSGNYWAPLYKSFTVEFSTSFESSTPDGKYAFDGDITGSTRLTIIGLCTRRKALELARLEIVETSEGFFREQLDPRSERYGHSVHCAQPGRQGPLVGGAGCDHGE